MPMNKYGVIDLGTNTFHLLIVESEHAPDFQVILKKRLFIKLAEEGINMIGTAAYQRAVRAMEEFRGLIDL